MKEALIRLRPVAELQLPFFPESLESDGVVDQRQLPNFAETQDNSNNFFGSTGVGSVLRAQPASPFATSPISLSRLKNYTPQVVIEVAQSLPVKRSRESTPDPINRKSRKRNIAPKLRHDDSQVQFETIESSPIANAALDSQLLTDRQKEVKERQQAEASMFPDLRSSPRPREKARSSSGSELPLHRSASKSRETASPVVVRQTTPTPQAEYDDYVNSSPTPTRALHDDDDLPDPPSSPPEVAKEQTTAYIGDNADIPSSPPEMAQDVEIDTTTSLDPSAQLDPYAENARTFSSFESISRQQNDSTALGSDLSVDDPKPAVDDGTSIAEAVISQSSVVVEQTETQNPAVDALDTSIRDRECSPATFQTPRSEVFHDAQTSPSPGRDTFNDDVFEDAQSSPRLNLSRTKKQQASSPLSYLDESSAMRLMVGYDQGSGRPRSSPRSVRFAADKENESEPILPISSKALPQLGTSYDLPSEIVGNGSKSLLEPQDSQELVHYEPPLLVANAVDSSPMPSLIPETPGPKAAVNLQIIDGEEIDLNKTIIVDDSILKEQEAPVIKRGKRKSDLAPVVTASPATKKGKHEAMGADSSEADNQDARPESKCIPLILIIRSTN